MQSIQGGVQQIDNDLAGSAGSSNNDFTCCWCTGGANTTDCSPYTKITTGGQLTCVSCP
ncbi:hypothetical protein ABID31_001605 [Chryseobacterium flavum]